MTSSLVFIDSFKNFDWSLLPLFITGSMWFIYFYYGRCECGALWHTREERKAFFIFVLMSIIPLIIFVILEVFL